MSKTEINIYGGAIQVIPDAAEVTQHITCTEDGKTVMVSNIKIIRKKRRDNGSDRT